jgi:hypothetical protein
MVNESGPLAQFAVDFAGPNQGLKLWPYEKSAPGDLDASVQTVKMRLEMLKFDKIMNCFWSPMMKKYQDDESLNALKERLPLLEQFVIDNLNGNLFLGGSDQPMYLDIHCIGYAERIIMLENSCW